MQISETRFIYESRVDYPGVIDLRRPRASRITSRHTRRIRAADCILRIVVGETIDVETKRQVLVRGQLVVHPAVEKKLAIVAGVVEVSVRRQHKRRQRSRKKRSAILTRVVSRREEERAIVHDWTTDGS